MLVPERAQSGLILGKKIINRFKCELDFYPELDFLNFGVKKNLNLTLTSMKHILKNDFGIFKKICTLNEGQIV